jgi:hypothetical protein
MNPRATFDELFFPGVARDKWQMMPWERMAITGLLARLRPKMALEIGVYYGGSLTLTSQYATETIAIDIDPDVVNRFNVPGNAEIWIGNSADLVSKALSQAEERNLPLNFVLIDADHSAAGVTRDIEQVLRYRPREPMVVLMHDSGTPGCRQGIISANWDCNPHVQFVECDFVPGQIIEHTVKAGRGEVWGGLAIAYLNAETRRGSVPIGQSAVTSIRTIHKQLVEA